MKVAIIEVSPRGHITLIETMIKIFLSSNDFKIKVFTRRNAFDELIKYNQLHGRLEFYVWNNGESIKDVFYQVNSFSPDRIYVITLENYFKDFLHFTFNAPVHLFIHNILDWVNKGWIQKFKDFRNGLNLRNWKFKAKFSFIYTVYRRRILMSILEKQGKLIVLNENLKVNLSRYVNCNRIDVIPFSLYDGTLSDTSFENDKIRICIPGYVTSHRRDYFGFLRALQIFGAHLKDKITIELLGGVDYISDGREIIEFCKALIKDGFNILYSEETTIPLLEFDTQLCNADLILGNLQVQINSYNIYGETKDSGIIYAMIKASKPGLLPSAYKNIPELFTSTKVYDSYADIFALLEHFIYNPTELIDLKKAALLNSKKFTPIHILESLKFSNT